jgi:hypothetical protein
VNAKTLMAAYIQGLLYGRDTGREAGQQAILRGLLEAVETDEEARVLQRIAERATATAMRRLLFHRCGS